MSPGPLSWTRTNGVTTFALAFHNLGNITLHPTAALTERGWFGLDTTVNFPTPGALPPAGTYVFNTHLQHAPLVAIGTASATIVSKAAAQPALVSLLYVPSWLTAGILAALAALSFGAWRAARFVRKARRAFAQVALLHGGQ